MKLKFRQGIVRYQQAAGTGTPLFLIKSASDAQYIDLRVAPDPTVISFAHGQEDYTVEETKTVPDAWGPFPPTGQTQYLYWDVNVITGVLSRGHTTVVPVIQPTAPPFATDDQHWFDTSENIMKVWNGTRWNNKIRLFAATYSSSATIIPYPLESQVGISNLSPSIKSGFLVFDSNGDPVRNRFGYFITTEHTLGTQTLNANSASAFQLEGHLKSVIASEFIPKFYLVTLVSEDVVKLASSSDTTTTIHGIVGEDLYIEETGRLITSGMVRNSQWNWASDEIGRYLFCSINGEVTLTPPASGISQAIGRIYDMKTIQLSIQMPYIL